MMLACLYALEVWKLKFVYFIAVAFSFLSGAIWGSGGISFVNEPDFKTAFEIGSYAATILAALVGVRTMNAWRAQFKHSEKFKSVKVFQKSLERNGVLEEYMYFLLHECTEIKFGRQSPDIGVFLAAAQDKQKAWLASCVEVGRCWGSMILLLDVVERKSLSCTPEEIECRVNRMVNRIYDMAFGGKPMDLMQLSDEINVLCVDAAKSSAELRDASNNILKKLVD